MRFRTFTARRVRSIRPLSGAEGSAAPSSNGLCAHGLHRNALCQAVERRDHGLKKERGAALDYANAGFSRTRWTVVAARTRTGAIAPRKKARNSASTSSVVMIGEGAISAKSEVTPLSWASHRCSGRAGLRRHEAFSPCLRPARHSCIQGRYRPLFARVDLPLAASLPGYGQVLPERRHPPSDL
jgi:hypothetical protein